MSRQWERMVRKNTKRVNRQRMKQGQPLIMEPSKEAMDKFLGRSWFLPVLFISISFFYAIVSFRYYETDTLFWLTVVAYFLLGVLYFFKRPYLKIGKKQLATRRLGVERYLSADDIEHITVQPGGITVKVKGKNSRWVFTRFQNLYNIPVIAERLKLFAQQNNIPYQEEIK